MVSKNSDDKSRESVSQNPPTKQSKDNDDNLDLNSWLELGMKLPAEKIAEHIYATPANVKPLHALRGLGIVFCNGFTNLYNCKGYPQKMGLGKNQKNLK
jgi:hypothetical protein